MRIRYVGHREVKTDNVARTGLSWKRGQVVDVADENAARILLAYPSVWQLEQPYEEAEAEAKAAPVLKFVKLKAT